MDDKQNGLAEGLVAIMKGIEESQQRELNARRSRFLDAFKDVGTLYLHVSNRLEHSSLVKSLQERYGENILVTVAPAESWQSSYDDHLDKYAEDKKRKQVIEPFEEFIAKKSIDAVVYLCNYLCDGYRSPIFPEDVVTQWHIWKAIEAAQKFEKPLIVGYLDNFCFGVQCYEREYLADPSKRKCDVKFFDIQL